MKTLPTNVSTEVVKTVTTPFHLVELQFDAGTLYLSTRHQVTYGGNTYVKSGAIVSGLTEGEVAISVNNTDSAASAIVLAEAVQDKTAKVHVAYGTGSSLTSDDVQLFFSGSMAMVKSMSTREVVILCNALYIDMTESPRIYCAPPLCNHLVAAGTIFGEYILEPSR